LDIDGICLTSFMMLASLYTMLITERRGGFSCRRLLQEDLSKE
jgi:hypothetical protein